MPSSKGSSWPRDGAHISCTAGWFFTTEPPGVFMWVKILAWMCFLRSTGRAWSEASEYHCSLTGTSATWKIQLTARMGQGKLQKQAWDSFLCRNVRKCSKTDERKVTAKVTQSCPTLCDPMDYIVHGIPQARILEWVAFLFPRGSSHPGIEPRSPELQADSLPPEPQGKPKTDENVSKDTQATLKEILICQIWDNMNIKISKDSDESEPPKYMKNLWYVKR